MNPGIRSLMALYWLNKCIWEYRKSGEYIPCTADDSTYKNACVITVNGLPPRLGWFLELYCGLIPAPEDPFEEPVASVNP